MLTEGQSRKRTLPDEGEKKRTVKACDRCKLKKIKCDGQVPCGRCQQRDTICHFGFATGRDEKSVSAAHVNQLQLHNEILVKAVKLMWERYGQPTMSGEGARTSSIHDIVASLGVLQAKSGLMHAGFDTSILDKLDLAACDPNGGGSPVIEGSSDSQGGSNPLPTMNLDQETVFPGTSFPGYLDTNVEPDLVSDRTNSSATDSSWSFASSSRSFESPLPQTTRTATLNRPNKPTSKISMPPPFLQDLLGRPHPELCFPPSYWYSIPGVDMQQAVPPNDLPALTPGLDWDNLINTSNLTGDNMEWGQAPA